MIDKLLALNAIKMRISEKYDDELYNTESQPQLLNTIKVPLNLHYLTDQLPGPNYDPLHNEISANTEYAGRSISKKKRSLLSNKENKKSSIAGSRESSLEPSNLISLNNFPSKEQKEIRQKPKQRVRYHEVESEQGESPARPQSGSSEEQIEEVEAGKEWRV